MTSNPLLNRAGEDQEKGGEEACQLVKQLNRVANQPTVVGGKKRN